MKRKKISAEHRASVIKRTALTQALVSAAVKWYVAGCPAPQANGGGFMGILQDKIDAYIDHDEQVKARAEQRRLAAIEARKK